jgi:hypothetical protein
MRILPALAGALLIAFASNYALAAPGAFSAEPKPTAYQSLTYNQGRGGLLSTMANSSVALILLQDRFASDDFPIFYLGVENPTKAATNLTASNISVATNVGPVRILTAGDLRLIERDEVNKRITSARWRAFGATLGAMGAAMGGNTGTFEATESSFGGTTTIEGTYTPPRDNSQAVRAYQEDAARAQRDAERAAGSLEGRYASAEKYGFRPSTIEAGKQTFTAMPIDELPAKATNLTISVNVNGDTHVFQYALTYSRK